MTHRILSAGVVVLVLGLAWHVAGQLLFAAAAWTLPLEAHLCPAMPGARVADLYFACVERAASLEPVR